ncbi:hypothetical protein [Bacillus piscicola]|uniref:hypothetical protein n=1 Tax=Bacillus piscicola TaxID=1632684 RepID=UPI001F088D6C|nr:hypothetical protein [Bacillus piscicola]
MEQQVMQTLNQKGIEKRLSVVRMEIDYELVSLHDAMLAEDLTEKNRCKRRLKKLRNEWNRLTVNDRKAFKTKERHYT